MQILYTDGLSEEQFFECVLHIVNVKDVMKKK